MTNGWTDIRNADVVLAMGGNPAENHPVGFRFVMEAKRNRNAKLVCVDPRFNRTAAVADRFVQIRAGSDIAFLGGLIHYALSRNRYHDEYVRLFTNAPFLVSEKYAFDEKRGVFSGWDDERKMYTDKSSWNYELDEGGFARVDPTLQHPRSVFQVMKRFYARYTPEMVSTICGCSADDFLEDGGAHHLDVHRRSRRHDHVRARLDAPQPLGAADSCRGDAAAAARQHRPARRRAQRAARSRQHPGWHRLRHGVPQPARLHRDPEGRSRVRSARSSTR